MINSDWAANLTETDMELDDDIATDKIVLYALDEACTKLEQAGEFVPFTVVLEGEDLHIEEHDFVDVEDCFAAARRTVYQMSNLADAYVFAYDGYVEGDSGTLDAVIVERGIKGEEAGLAFAVVYEVSGEDEDEADAGLEAEELEFEFDDEICILGDVPSFFSTDDNA
jgi:hypothetical protein